MLGEAARTAADAERYHEAYAHAIAAIAADQAARAGTFSAPGISVKLSALHPRFVYAQRARVMPSWRRALSRSRPKRSSGGLSLTVDAEEADRLELTLDVFEAVAKANALAGWNGLGLAVQAYQKRALAVDRLACRAGARDAGGAFRCDWSRAPIGTPRSSAPRNAGLPIIPCSRARPRPTCRIWPAPRRCSPSPRSSIRNSPRTTRTRWPPC